MFAWLRRRLDTVFWWRYEATVWCSARLHTYRHHINGTLIGCIGTMALRQGVGAMDAMFVALAIVSEF